jgi:hypothetical protein
METLRALPVGLWLFASLVISTLIYVWFTGYQAGTISQGVVWVLDKRTGNLRMCTVEGCYYPSAYRLTTKSQDGKDDSSAVERMMNDRPASEQPNP